MPQAMFTYSLEGGTVQVHGLGHKTSIHRVLVDQRKQKVFVLAQRRKGRKTQTLLLVGKSGTMVQATIIDIVDGELDQVILFQANGEEAQLKVCPKMAHLDDGQTAMAVLYPATGRKMAKAA